MNFFQAMTTLDQGKLDSVYLLVGEEHFFSERFLNKMKALLIPGELSEFNWDLFSGSEFEVDQLCNSLQTLPIMTDKRLVVLKEAQDLSDKEWTQLESYDPKNLDCVFIIQANQLDRRKKLIKKWFERGVLIECLTPTEAERPQWIKYLAQENKVELQPEALAFISQMGGNSLEEIENDFIRLSLYYKEPKKLSIEEVALILGRSREQSIFALSEAVGQRDRTQSLYLYQCLQQQGESEIALTALMARQLRILIKVKDAQSLGLKGQPLATKVGVSPYFMASYLQQVSRWTQEELGQGLLGLAQLEKNLKSSSVDTSLWFDHFLLYPTESSQSFFV